MSYMADAVTQTRKSSTNLTKSAGTNIKHSIAKPKTAVKKPTIKNKSAETPKTIRKPNSVKSKTITKRKSADKIVPKLKTVSAKSVKTKSAPKTKVIAKKTVTKSGIAKTLKFDTKSTAKKIVKKPRKVSKVIKPKVTKSKPATRKPNVKTVSKTIKTVLAKSPKTTAKTKVVKKPTVKKKIVKVISVKKITAKAKLKNSIAVAAAKRTALQKSLKTKVKKTIPKVKDQIKQVENTTKKKQLRAISSAVFRGKKTTYNFKVYEIKENIGSIPAVFIISKRITDRRKRGHHSLVCIGQTESVANALKIHRKSKCLKQNEANAISILHIEDEKERHKIAEDLKAAHSIACNQR